MSVTKTVTNGIDTWAGQGRPSKTHRGDKRLGLQTSAGNDSFAYLWFKNPAPRGANVIYAEIGVHGAGDGWGIHTMSARRITEQWGASKLNWNNRPSVGSTVRPSAAQGNPANGTLWVMEVTSLAQLIASDPGANHGYRIELDSATQRFIYAFNHANPDFRPYYLVQWADAPEAPTSLSPSGGRSVSLAKPILRFDYLDVSGEDDLAAVRAQFDEIGGDFTTPTYDTGEHPSTVPQVALTDVFANGTPATSYPGLADLAETQWRVQVKDESGQWSPWSDPAAFRRDIKNAVTINNPAAAPDNHVSEWTPPIMATMPGALEWRVTIVRADRPTTVYHVSDRLPGPALDYTLPKRVLTDATDLYRLYADAWDDKDRENTPGDPRYSRAVRDFTFAEDPTPAPVTGLTLGQEMPYPWAVLEWDRTEAPDSYAITRDGQVIESDIDSVDVFVSGTHYRWVDKDPAPNRQHTWRVQSVVNGKTSAGNPSVAGEVFAAMVWLSMPEADLIAPITTVGGSWTVGESSAVHIPPGGTHAIKLRQGRRGWEGDLEGHVVDYADVSAREWGDALREMRDLDGEYIITLANVAFRCSVTWTDLSPIEGTDDDVRHAAFQFWSLDRRLA